MKRTYALLLSLLLLVALSACGKKEPPTLKVTVEQQGRNMVITADTGPSFKLGVDGHMHVRLNDGPEAMPNGAKYTIGNREPGTYKVFVELADRDHNALGISETVMFEMK